MNTNESSPDETRVQRRTSVHRRTARRAAGPTAPSKGAAARAHGERRPRQQPQSQQQGDLSEPSAIVAGIRRGDKAAATEMVIRYEKGVRHVLMRLIPNPADRDDLTHDVWVVALTRIRRGELRSPDLLFGFLTGTARGLALNERRRNHRRATDPNSDAVEAYPADDGDPAEIVERAQFRQVAVRAIGTLRTPLYREVLLRSVANHDSERTCAELGIGVLQYRGVLCKAKDRLKKVIRETTAPDVPKRRNGRNAKHARRGPPSVHAPGGRPGTAELLSDARSRAASLTLEGSAREVRGQGAAPYDGAGLRLRVSVIRVATTAPDAAVRAATIHIAAATPSVSATMPANSAPNA